MNGFYKLFQIAGTSKRKKPKDLLETIYIKSGYELIKLKASDIIHIKSDADYTEIITAQKTHISKTL